MAHVFVVEDESHWGGAHGETRVSRVGFVDAIDREKADGVDAVEGGFEVDWGDFVGHSSFLDADHN